MTNYRVLIIDTYYNKMLKLLPDKNIGLTQNEWEDIYDDLMLGTGFSYNYYLKKLGTQSNLLVANNLNQFSQDLTRLKQSNWRKAYYYSRLFSNSNFLFRMSPLHQNMLNFIEEIRPHVLFVQDINLFPPIFSSLMKSRGIKLVGEIASPLPPSNFFSDFDLVLSSLDNIVRDISNLNVRSSFHPLGFDSRINDRLRGNSKEIDILFVGSYSPRHKNTIPLLVEFAKKFSSFRIYGNFPNSVLRKSNLIKNYHGEVWGKSMFEVLSNSKIVINRHSQVSGEYANNMRMFEVTGVGSLLLTEAKLNLDYYFSSPTEVATYTNPTEATNKSKQLLQDGHILREITKKGQIRTLNNHTYELLTPKLLKFVESVL